MVYGLTRRVLECKHFLPITEEEFVRIRSAQQQLAAALEIEEKVDMVLRNYVEYEHELLQITLQHALFQFGVWSEFRQLVQQVNRRLVNLLTTCRLYLDQLRHDSRPLVSVSESLPDPIHQITSSEYQTRLGYRVMEALRNHVQHRGLPIHSITLGGSWTDMPEGNRRKQTTTPFLHIDILRNDPKFKKAVLNEIWEGERRIPLN